MYESEVNVMPYKPKIPCKYPGCSELAPSDMKYCPQHYKPELKRPKDTRPNSARRGYDYKWRKVRAVYLRKHPLCVRCMAEGKYTMATVVDHIVPHRGNPVLMWDENNYQALCKSCHDRKTMTEDRNIEYKY